MDLKIKEYKLSLNIILIFIKILALCVAYISYILLENYLEVDRNKTTFILCGIITFFLLSLLLLFLAKSQISELKLKLEDTKAEKIIAESKLKHYTFLKLDKNLVSSIHQYLIFFPNYVRSSKKINISMYISEEPDGLDISFEIPMSIKKNEFQVWLNEYLNFLIKDEKEFKIETVENISKIEKELLIFELKNKIKSYKQSIEAEKQKLQNKIVNIEKNENGVDQSYKDLHKETLKAIQKMLDTFKNPTQINNFGGIQIINSKIENSTIQISEINDKIIGLIEKFADNSTQKTALLSNLETLKSETASEEEKKKSGGMIKEFLKSCSGETAKQIIKTIAENGEGWVQYITGLF